MTDKDLQRQKETQRKWRITHLDVKRKLNREEYYRLKTEIFSHYSNGEIKCKFCGESRIECLQLDHIHNDGYIDRKSGRGIGRDLWRSLRKEKFPEGFQILCANCNWYKRSHPEWKGDN